ncbi:MAG TPA: alpha/beta fold hydrolase [Gemmatimonadales bacterium]
MRRTFHGQQRVTRWMPLVLLTRVLAGPSLPAQQASACPGGRTAAGLYYECAGAGEDVMILIHAFSVDRRMWEAQVDWLKREARVIAYDLRGHGNSVAPEGPYTAHDDLLGLMDELHVPTATLIGLSNGARVALDFALTHPSRVRAMVLAGPGVSGYTSTAPMAWMDPVVSAIRSGDLVTAADRWAQTPLMHIPGDAAAASRVRELTQQNRAMWGYRTNPEVPLDPPAIGRLGEIGVPVLVVSGESDLPDLRRLANTVATEIPGATLVLIPGAGHMVNLAAPGPFNQALRSFLTQPRGGR